MDTDRARAFLMRKMFGRLIGEKIGEYISNVRGGRFRSIIDECNERIFHSNTIVSKEVHR